MADKVEPYGKHGFARHVLCAFALEGDGVSNILVVEDDKTIREALDVILRKEGHIVLAFRSAEEALQNNGWDPDLLICDYKLPGINGIEMIERMKEQVAGLESIVITAFGSIDLAIESVRKGASDFLTKPLNLPEMIVRLNKVLEEKQLGQEARRLYRRTGGIDPGIKQIG